MFKNMKNKINSFKLVEKKPISNKGIDISKMYIPWKA